MTVPPSLHDHMAALRALVGMPVADVELALGDLEELPPRAYGQVDGLAASASASSGPATILSRDGQVVLVTRGGADGTPDDLAGDLGPPDARLRSRVGKRWLHHVHAAHGLAFSTPLAQDELAAIEVFAPCSLDDYIATWYEDPGRFVE